MCNYQRNLSFWIVVVITALGIKTGGCHRKVVFVQKIAYWNESHSYCKNHLNGKLASASLLYSLGDKLLRCHSYSSSIQYWIGNITVDTPYISLIACIEPSARVPMYQQIDMTVEQCAAFCINFPAFEIQQYRCRCHTTKVKINPVNASRCDITCRNQDQFCGGKDVANYYTFFKGTVETWHGTGKCAYGSCTYSSNDNSYPLFQDLCESYDNLNNILVFSSSFNYTKGNSRSWRNASSECVSLSGSYPVSALNISYCDKMCPDYSYYSQEGCSNVWTSTRKYEGNIVAEGSSLQGFSILSCSKVTVQGSFLRYSDSRYCASGNGFAFACETDEVMTYDHDTHCIVLIGGETAGGTTETISTETTTTSVKTDILQSTEEIEFTTSSKPKDELYTNPSSITIGSIIGASIASFLVIAAIIKGLIIFRKRRGSPSLERHSIESQQANIADQDQNVNNTSERIYIDAKENDYDHLHVRRKDDNKDMDDETRFYGYLTSRNTGRRDTTYDKVKSSRSTDLIDDTYSHAERKSTENFDGNYDSLQIDDRARTDTNSHDSY